MGKRAPILILIFYRNQLKTGRWVRQEREQKPLKRTQVPRIPAFALGSNSPIVLS